jgi:hypothetical protein
LTLTDDPKRVAAGRALLKRVVDEYPDARLHVCTQSITAFEYGYVTSSPVLKAATTFYECGG